MEEEEEEEEEEEVTFGVPRYFHQILESLSRRGGLRGGCVFRLERQLFRERVFMLIVAWSESTWDP